MSRRTEGTFTAPKRGRCWHWSDKRPQFGREIFGYRDDIITDLMSGCADAVQSCLLPVCCVAYGFLAMVDIAQVVLHAVLLDYGPSSGLLAE